MNEAMLMYRLTSIIIKNEVGRLTNVRINCVEQRPLQTLIVSQLARKPPAFYTTRKAYKSPPLSRRIHSQSS